MHGLPRWSFCAVSCLVITHGSSNVHSERVWNAVFSYYLRSSNVDSERGHKSSIFSDDATPSNVDSERVCIIVFSYYSRFSDVDSGRGCKSCIFFSYYARPSNVELKRICNLLCSDINRGHLILIQNEAVNLVFLVITRGLLRLI